jgi:hypothetical protein
LKEIRPDGGLLFRVQMFQRLLDQVCSLFRRESGHEGIRVRERSGIKFLDLQAGVITPAFQVPPLVDRARVCIEEQ